MRWLYSVISIFSTFNDGVEGCCDELICTETHVVQTDLSAFDIERDKWRRLWTTWRERCKCAIDKLGG